MSVQTCMCVHGAQSRMYSLVIPRESRTGSGATMTLVLRGKVWYISPGEQELVPLTGIRLTKHRRANSQSDCDIQDSECSGQKSARKISHGWRIC